MTAISLDQDLTVAKEPSRYFYVWIAGLCVFVALAGFAPTYWLPVVSGTFKAAPIVHVHGLLFTGWTIFFLAQTTLIAMGRVSNHRSMGLVGISIATVMVVVGFLVAINSVRESTALGFEQAAKAFMVVPVTGILLFAGLFIAAIANVRRPEVHKRLMLVATASILQAAVGRWFRLFLAPPEVRNLPVTDVAPPPVMFTMGAGIVVDLIIVIAIVHDWRARGRPHPAYLIGGALVLFTQIVRVPLSTTAVWRSIADGLVALAG